ncbi:MULTISPECIES: hypothetical protein [unclassified Streptomyces]|uniref:hypothetical protein n=1 Tax=unclassified Streptomyces TaxID=2593676 RepID=UPI002DDB4461|nr:MULTISPECIES: hypothetical protein [unclassified Streptomyces]WSA96653.1 hypothetical protein OIE63_37705 [Streptomyces sp. NBC_01795]WSB81068.1 hypothetical protein OHB04_38825 [Streptomyces sp. NBC_01775]WSS10722.1 hypothetical protein OG533_01435 [Streptomyces sp. NBC_01186]WSS39417.1 hypothetical protein OG220_01460 [Streptomyces sp. NBC_01187]
MRRRIRHLMRRLDVQPPLSVRELCQAVAADRGRAIELRAHPLPACGPHGLWLKLPTVDVVLYQECTSRIHQDHILLHELGHILAGHQGRRDVEGLRYLFPALAPELVEQVLQRHTCVEPEEREAELIATIIGEWASVLDVLVPPARTVDPSAARVRSILGDHGGWQ